MIVNINVVGQTLVVDQRYSTLISGTKHFIRFVFLLDDLWAGLTSTIQFKQGDDCCTAQLDQNHSAYLPDSITEGVCEISLMGVSADVIAKSAPLQITMLPDPIKATSEEG